MTEVDENDLAELQQTQLDERDQLKQEQLDLNGVLGRMPNGKQGSLEWRNREDILDRIRTIKARIKEINISLERQKVESASNRRVRGRAEFASNNARQKIKTAWKVDEPTANLGTWILNRAEKLHKLLTTIKPDKRQDFTNKLVDELAIFIANQKDFLKHSTAELSRPLTPSELFGVNAVIDVDESEKQWRNTWEKE